MEYRLGFDFEMNDSFYRYDSTIVYILSQKMVIIFIVQDFKKNQIEEIE